MVSCLGVIGMTPDRLVSPTVGLMPTTELDDDGQSIDPSVSDPSVTAAMFAAAATPGPALDPPRTAWPREHMDSSRIHENMPF